MAVTRVMAVAMLVAGLGAARPAHAQDVAPTPVSAEEKEIALRRYEEGKRAYQAGRYREAIDRFLQADRIVASPAFAYNVSLAYEALGEVGNALRWTREYQKRAPDAPDAATVAQ